MLSGFKVLLEGLIMLIAGKTFYFIFLLERVKYELGIILGLFSDIALALC